MERSLSKHQGFLDRLLSHRKIDEDGCWLWTGPQTTGGYGKFDSHKAVHIVAYELFYGKRNKSKEIMHRCNKPLCFNPTCISEGTRKQNQEYAALCHRKSTRSTNKLDYEKAKIIRLRVKNGERQKNLAEEFGVAPNTISMIVSNKKWKTRLKVGQ